MTYGRYKFSLAPAGTRVYSQPKPPNGNRKSRRAFTFLRVLFIHLQQIFFRTPLTGSRDYHKRGTRTAQLPTEFLIHKNILFI